MPGTTRVGWRWRAQEPHTSLRPGLFRAITPILTSPGAFLARKAHCGGPGSTRCRKERAEQDPGAAVESAEIAGPRAEKWGAEDGDASCLIKRRHSCALNERRPLMQVGNSWTMLCG